MAKNQIHENKSLEDLSVASRMTGVFDEASLKRHFRIQYLQFWLLGLINNLAYVVVVSSCKSIAEHFDMEDLLAVIQWSNVSFGIVMKLVNGRYLTDMKYTVRLTLAASMQAIGITIIAVGCFVNFWMCVVGVSIMGMGCSLGESSLIGGYFKLYDPKLTGAWSSGTGGAGVFGALLYIGLFSTAGLSNEIVFFCLLPTIYIYYAAFFYLHKVYGPDSSYRVKQESSTIGGDSKTDALLSSGHDGDHLDIAHPIVFDEEIPDSLLGDNTPPGSSTPMRLSFSTPKFLSSMSQVVKAPQLRLNDADEEENDYNGTNKDAQMVIPLYGDMTFSDQAKLSDSSATTDIESLEQTEVPSMGAAWKYAGFVTVNLGLVYFLEYVVCVGFASMANEHKKTGGFFSKNSYEVLSLCYQVGVLISRSSIGVLVVDKIQIITIAQFANFVLWFLQVALYFLPLYSQFPLMILVGLFAGGMYVNCFYKVMRDERLGIHKEKGLNLLSIAANVGSMMSSVFTLIASKTFFKHKT